MKNKTFEDVLPYSLAEVYRHFRGSDVVGLSKMLVQFCQITRAHIKIYTITEIFLTTTNRNSEKRDARMFI